VAIGLKARLTLGDMQVRAGTPLFAIVFFPTTFRAFLRFGILADECRVLSLCLHGIHASILGSANRLVVPSVPLQRKARHRGRPQFFGVSAKLGSWSFSVDLPAVLTLA
jgi:hypothetical protein